MRAARSARAVAIERDAGAARHDRRRTPRRSACRSSSIVRRQGARCLAELRRPDAVFVGGGVLGRGLIEACWPALQARRPARRQRRHARGRGARSSTAHARHGGELCAASRSAALEPSAASRLAAAACRSRSGVATKPMAAARLYRHRRRPRRSGAADAEGGAPLARRPGARLSGTRRTARASRAASRRRISPAGRARSRSAADARRTRYPAEAVYDARRARHRRPSRRGPRRGRALRGRSVLLRLVHVSARAPRRPLPDRQIVPGVTSLAGRRRRKPGARSRARNDVLTIFPRCSTTPRSRARLARTPTPRRSSSSAAISRSVRTCSRTSWSARRRASMSSMRASRATSASCRSTPSTRARALFLARAGAPRGRPWQ